MRCALLNLWFQFSFEWAEVWFAHYLIIQCIPIHNCSRKEWVFILGTFRVNMIKTFRVIREFGQKIPHRDDGVLICICIITTQSPIRASTGRVVRCAIFIYSNIWSLSLLLKGSCFVWYVYFKLYPINPTTKMLNIVKIIHSNDW